MMITLRVCIRIYPSQCTFPKYHYPTYMYVYPRFLCHCMLNTLLQVSPSISAVVTSLTFTNAYLRRTMQSSHDLVEIILPSVVEVQLLGSLHASLNFETWF